MFKGKRVLCTGSEGMIGQELVKLLEEQGAEVFRFDFKRFWCENSFSDEDCLECGKRTKYPLDVRFASTIHKVFEAFRPEYVFHLFGIKGSPKLTKERPANFMIPMLQGDTNIIEACQKHDVKGVLYTSSIAVEHPEDDLYPATAKLTAEMLINAMRIQYPDGPKWCIVRPANVYGKYDNFDNPNAMVVTSLIKKALSEPELEVWGDGTQVRDFIHAKDVARGMIKAMIEMPKEPVNLCSGEGVTIKKVASIIANLTGKSVQYNVQMPRGSHSRVMKPNWEFKPEISIEEGLKEVVEWVKKKEN